MTTPAAATQTAAARAQKLDAALQQAANPAKKAAEQTQAATPQAQKFAKMAENPFFKIIKDPELKLSAQKRDAMVKLLSYDKTKTEAENEKMAQLYSEFLEFVEEQRVQNAKTNIAGQNTKVMAELQKVINEFAKGLNAFKEEIGPFAARLQAIYNIRLSGNAAALLEEIVQDRKAVEQGRVVLEEESAALDAMTAEMSGLTTQIKGLEDQIIDLSDDYRGGMSLFGVKGSSKTQINHNAKEIERLKEKQTELTGKITTKNERIAQLETSVGGDRPTQFGELAADKAELVKMLDISSDDHVAAHEKLKQTSLDFIGTSETRIDSVLGNVESVNELTAETARKNGKLVLMSAIMNEAVKTALANNQQTLAEFAAPADAAAAAAEDEITKAEREETHGAVQRFIKSVSLADTHTTEVRNALTREKDSLNSMLESNQARIRGTKHLRTSGIANMSTEMAITMTALADAANAESVQMAQTMVDAMGQTALDIRSKEVLRQVSDLGVRNQQLAAAILATQQTEATARAGVEAQHDALVEMNKNLRGLTDVTLGLQETLKDGEAVYAKAAADAEADLALQVAQAADAAAAPAADVATNDNKATAAQPAAAPAPSLF